MTDKSSYRAGGWFIAGWIFFNVLLILPHWFFQVNGIWIIQGEWLLLGLFWIWRAHWLTGLLSILIYGSMLFFSVYQYFSWRVYACPPDFYNDWALLREVLPIFLGEFSYNRFMSYVPIIVSGLLGLGLMGFLFNKLHQSTKAFRISKALSIGLTIGALLTLFFQGISPVQWQSPLFIQSVRQSFQSYEETHAPIDSAHLSMLQDQSMAIRPNIYCVFLESYGSLVWTSKDLAVPFHDFGKELEQNLTASGFAIASAMSKAPVSGGRSWLSFTSTFCGRSIQSQPHYKHLLETEPDYPHLVRYLGNQGYYCLRMNTLRGSQNQKNIPYALYDRFFAFDDWIKFHHIPYQGPAFGKFDAIPDQFALHYAREEFLQDKAIPHFLFFISLNSHSPWNEVPPLLADWRQLNQAESYQAAHEKEQTILGGMTMGPYLHAMKYELGMMERFIQTDSDSSIFILIGDHQPPLISPIGSTFDTPVHIISKRGNWVKNWHKWGFDEGILPQSSDLKHEDIYSLFVQSFAYPAGHTQSPPRVDE